MHDGLLDRSQSKTNEEVLKPHIFLFEGKWHCLRDWNLKRAYRSVAPSWNLLFIPEEERWIGADDHNLFIQREVVEGFREFCVEVFYYHEDRTIMWYSTPLRCGLSAYTH